MSDAIDTCGCCEGVQQLTPVTIDNRPGLPALAYRVGIHATFVETMLARLSNMSIPLGELDTILDDQNKKNEPRFPLQGLTARSLDDPAIAMLDAWAVVAEVLTFYQERIANEGYLRTATERRSILELTKLIGYKLRPGVAASVFLSYTLEDGQTTTIPQGSRVQSLPGPAQLPQPFETSFDIDARAAWNAIKPRMSVPQYISQILDPDTGQTPTPLSTHSLYINTHDGALYLQGTSTNLKQGDPLLFVFNDNDKGQVFGHTQAIDPHQAEKYTRAVFPPDFVPYTFFRNLEDLLAGYQHVDAFGLTAGDTLIQSVVAALQSLEKGLENIENDGLKQLANNEDTGDLQDPSLSTIFYFLTSLCILYEKAVQPKSVSSDTHLVALFSKLGRIHPNILDITNTVLGTQGSDLTTLLDQLDLKNIPPARLASWVGGIINDVKAIMNTVPDFRASIQDVCSPVVTTNIAAVVPLLAKAPSLQPANSVRLPRSAKSALSRKSDLAPRIIQTLNQAAAPNIYNALSNATVTATPPLRSVYAFRVKAAPFGSTAPKQATTTKSQTGDPPQDVFTTGTSSNDWTLGPDSKTADVLDLDAQYDKILPDSWIVVEYAAKDATSESTIKVFRVDRVETVSRADYGMSAKVTRLKLKLITTGQSWLPDNLTDLGGLRHITIYAQSEALALAEEPLTEDVQDGQIELDDLYDGLQSGRWVVVSGERSDIANTSGIRTSELMLLESVTQEVRVVDRIPPSSPPVASSTTGTGGLEESMRSSPPVAGSTTGTGTTPDTQAIDLPGDKTHTILHFSTPLSYTYKRSTVTVGANVVKATHGETKNEVLGSGDGTKGMQQFTLKQSPLTYVAAATAAGAESTLHVYVNDIEWHEQDSLDAQGPKDRVFVTQTDDQDKTTVIFGNGIHGARLPTAAENVKATYRAHIGKEGNVDAEQIKLLATRPLGVKGVINPKAATGGADRESRDQARRNAPLAVQALDRVVSVQDYADFARTFAGIAKASVRLLSDGRRQIVHLTIAGQDNIPIDPTSDLYQNLFLALRKLGNPSEPLRVDVCEVKLLVLSMRVRVLPDYQLEKVVPNIRTALLTAFGFEQRDLGQPVYQSEVLSVVQQVPGVAFVELEILDAVDQSDLVKALDTIHQQELQEAVSSQKSGEFATQGLLDLLNLQIRQVVPVSQARTVSSQPGVFAPAQIAFFTPDIADTIIINELTSPIEPVARTRKVGTRFVVPARNASTGTGVM